jgi:hypothetical protein
MVQQPIAEFHALPLETKQSEKTWLHMTESYAMQQSPGMRCPRELADGAIWNSTAKSRRMCIQKIFVLE